MAGKRKKRIGKQLLALALALSLASCTLLTTGAFDTEENQREHQQLEQENEQFQQELDETNAELREKQLYSRELQKQISELTGKISEGNKKIKELNAEISEKQALIDERLKAVEERLNKLRSRLRSIYMAGDVSSLEIILQAKDFSDFVDKMEMVKNISRYDDQLISALQGEMEVISADQKKLKENKEQVEAEKKALEANKQEVSRLSEENEAIILELMKARTDKQAEIRANEEKQAELERALEQYQKELAEEQRLERVRKAQALREQRMRERVARGENVIDRDGHYVWPCPGFTYLTSTFDEWRGVRNHGAIDIAGPGIYGTPVLACWDGIVIETNKTCTHDYGKETSCGCGGGFGNYVMLDNGDDHISIYAHLCAVEVFPGEEVEAGQVIGYVGTTGYSTGPHLHFELRYNGERYDPLTEYDW